MSEQLNLFGEPEQSEYPKLMNGYWIGKYLAFAVVDTPEHEAELAQAGYVIIQ